MKIEVNIQKKYFLGILVAVLFLAAVVITYAYNSNFNSGNPAVMGHSSDEVNVNISGQTMTLQSAINNGLFGNQVSNTYQLPAGFILQYVNAGEDKYTVTGPVVITQVPDTWVDTCDGDMTSEYTCKVSENFSCIDIHRTRFNDYDNRDVWEKIEVNCVRAIAFIKYPDASNYVFEFDGVMQNPAIHGSGSALNMVISLSGGTATGFNNRQPIISASYSFGIQGIPIDGSSISVQNVTGNVSVNVIQQPLSSNGYTAKVSVKNTTKMTNTHSDFSFVLA